jgi:hypothetical protein
MLGTDSGNRGWASAGVEREQIRLAPGEGQGYKGGNLHPDV